MRRKHFYKGTRTYTSWSMMLTRCRNPNNCVYQEYGAKGIVVCERWSDFLNFLSDMGERPHGTTLDRINNAGNYEPQNCRWATRIQQNNNRANNRLITWGGKTQSIAEWARELQMPMKALNGRLNRLGWTIERAITQPLRVYS